MLASFLSFRGLSYTTVCFSDIPSRMREGGVVSRIVALAYLGAGDGPVLNPLNYSSASLKRILMFFCRPTASKSGARTVFPDTHVAAGNELQTYF